MRPLSVPELLNIWERGLGSRPFERALTILSAAAPESCATDLARMSIGRRDASLLRVREWAFGSELAMMAACPRCHRELETAMTVADLCMPIESASDSETSPAIGDYRFRCRAPNTDDLAACVGLDMAMSRRTLFTRCVLDSTLADAPVAADKLPAEIIDEVIERIAEADRADIRIDLTCPDCDYRWDELFDIVSYFWTEIDAWARRILREVHILASVYGWRESDILALGPVRRQIYLAMAEA